MKITALGQQARIESFRDITPTVREFTLLCTRSATAWQPGAHIEVQIVVRGQLQKRHYSLLPCDTPGLLKIAVKRADPGRGGSHAMWQLQVGDTLQISDPLNKFSLDLTAPAYLLIAGGIGITPLLSMAGLLAQRGANVAMLYGARDAQELAYLDELRSTLGNRLHIALSRSMDVSSAIAALPEQAQTYVCGPTGMLNAVRAVWLAQQRSASLLRFETFGSSENARAFTVKLPRHDLSFEVSPQLSLLDALEQQGVAALSGCRKGECGLCILPVLALEGSIEHRDVFFSQHEKQSNAQICVCVSRVNGIITLDSAYRPDSSNSYARPD